jgi:hypothetical protein
MADGIRFKDASRLPVPRRRRANLMLALASSRFQSTARPSGESSNGSMITAL